ncbi:sulfotransferase [Plakobranchus ocellatus]|uniref:Sulfotransferase n=1 Tax=Plakobranchus ocellatus TaxID=259542 RepID=A0AAV4AQF6_9GAST|nr:sulfotransferase [Plakobranchus ocellatus]
MEAAVGRPNTCESSPRKDTCGPDSRLWVSKCPADGNARAKAQAVENIDMQCVDGIWLMKFDAVKDMASYLKKLRSLNMRNDDVISCGFPRSGNHWCFELVNMILFQTTKFREESFACNLLDIPRDLETIKSPRNLVTHLRPLHFPKQAMDKKTKIIYILRNPKDVLVSMYLMNREFAKYEWRFLGTWQQFLELHKSGDLPGGSWWEHVRAVESFAAANPHIPLHIFQYENAKERPAEEIRKLCHFLGTPDELAEEIARVTRFENMKKMLGAGGKIAAMEKLVFHEKEVVLRKGQVGDWKNWFSHAESEQFDRDFEANTRGSEWAKRVRTYMGLPALTK